jgi:small-conductance mechanosensitive channel
VIVPNETVVTSVVVNRSTGDLSAPVMASVWVPLGADLEASRQALARLEPS